MPDYSEHLYEIAAAPSRPATPAWLVAIVSTILGFSSAFLLQFVQQLSAERSKRDRIRRLLYVDLAEVFLTVEGIMGFGEMDEPARWDWQKEQLKSHASFKAEEHLHASEDTYMQLAERSTADVVYVYFHKALDDVDHWWSVNWSIARQVFAQAVYEDVLQRKHFRKFLGNRRAERLRSQCERIHRASQEMSQQKGHDQKP